MTVDIFRAPGPPRALRDDGVGKRRDARDVGAGPLAAPARRGDARALHDAAAKGVGAPGGRGGAPTRAGRRAPAERFSAPSSRAHPRPRAGNDTAWAG